MLLSKSCVYGLRASLYLATSQKKEYTSIKEMSEKLDISFHFLTKTLQKLTASDLLESLQGPKGGVRLTRSGDEISLLDIVVAIDGDELLTKCILGLPGCGIEKPCPLHANWANTRDEIRAMLETTTLSEMAQKGKQDDLRITVDGRFVWD